METRGNLLGASDYYLNVNSPCVNAGANRSWMANTVDLEGSVRIRYGAVDLGVYERIYEGTIYRFRQQRFLMASDSDRCGASGALWRNRQDADGQAIIFSPIPFKLNSRRLFLIAAVC